MKHRPETLRALEQIREDHDAWMDIGYRLLRRYAALFFLGFALGLFFGWVLL